MKVEKIIDGDKLTVRIEGAIDTVTAPQLSAELDLTTVKELFFDISQVGYVSSAGLRVFLNCQKQMVKSGGSLSVSGANEAVQHIFKITGFSKIINFV